MWKIQVYLKISFIFTWCILYGSQGFAAEEGEFAASDIFAKQADAIVLVAASAGKQSRLGTGFILQSDGFIATSYHLLAGSKKSFVKLRNNEVYYKVKIVSFDKQKDIAIVKIEAHNLKTVSIGNSDNLQIGQRVVAIGNPLGLEYSVSDGLISAKRQVKKNFTLLQTSVPLSTGSSGGPLFNLQGEVVGLVTASNTKGQVLNFAVPINDVKQLFTKVRRASGKDQRAKGRTKISRKNKNTPQTQNNYALYTVKPRDTLYSLAKIFHTTIFELMKINGMADSRIYSGQKLKIPQTPSLEGVR